MLKNGDSLNQPIPIIAPPNPNKLTLDSYEIAYGTVWPNYTISYSETNITFNEVDVEISLDGINFANPDGGVFAIYPFTYLFFNNLTIPYWVRLKGTSGTDIYYSNVIKSSLVDVLFNGDTISKIDLTVDANKKIKITITGDISTTSHWHIILAQTSTISSPSEDYYLDSNQTQIFTTVLVPGITYALISNTIDNPYGIPVQAVIELIDA